MVNVAGRSKGCSTCRQRKLKCDESTPKCFQCVKRGLHCSGPRTGAIFIHALPKRPALRSNIDVSGDVAYENAMKSTHRVFNGNPARPSISAVYRPSRIEIFDQLFVSHFIESFAFVKPNSGKQSSTWLDELATLIISPTSDAVKHSIRASSMSFYGFMTQDVAVQNEASRWYLKALQGLQCQLSKQAPCFTGDMICAAVMLTHFESLAGTAPGAWFQHVRGASMMIVMGGPESCRQGFLHDIFRHLRLLAAISALFRNEQHPFSAAEWMNVPFELLPKGPFDELVDVYFSLLPCLAIADQMIAATGDDLSSYKAELSTMVHQIISRLHLWWSQCAGRTDLSLANPETNIATNTELIHFPSDPYDVPLLPHRDMPTTALAALFYAANVIVFRLLFLVSSSAPQYEYRIQQHVLSILSALDFVRSVPQSVSQRGFIMVALPLQIAQIWAPFTDGDNIAKSLHRNWSQGISSSKTPTEFFAHVASHIYTHYQT